MDRTVRGERRDEESRAEPDGSRARRSDTSGKGATAELPAGAGRERLGSAGGSAAVGRMLGMQRLVGNRAVSRLVDGLNTGRAGGARAGSGAVTAGTGPAAALQNEPGADPAGVREPGPAASSLGSGSIAGASAGAPGDRSAGDAATAAGAAGPATEAGPAAEAEPATEAGTDTAPTPGPSPATPTTTATNPAASPAAPPGRRTPATPGRTPAPAHTPTATPGPETPTPTTPTAVLDGDLITTELAEHERWAGSFGSLGTAGSDQRARYLLDVTGQGAVGGAAGGAVMGLLMSGIGAAIGQVVGRRLATLAVARGFSATPVPGLGPAIGGVMAGIGLVTRDWGATADTIGRMGTGTGYERLANDLEGLAEVLDVTMSVMDVLAGVFGGIAVGMWVATVLSAGTLSPLAAVLSGIALGMNLASTAVGLIISAVVRPVVVALRALHAFESQGDPAQIEEDGAMLASAASQVTGVVAGAVSAKVGGHLGNAGGTHLNQRREARLARDTGGTPHPSASGAGGPRLHVEVPEGPGGHAVAGGPTAPHPGARPHPGAAVAGTGPAASAPRPHTGESPHPITPDVEIRGDFSDEALSVHGRRNPSAAEAGDIARHGHQGPRGSELTSEHVIPGAQMRDATRDPAHGGAPDWQRSTESGADGADYTRATTIAEHNAVAEHKTRLDNEATEALKARGGPSNLTDDLLLPSLDRHQRGVDTAVARGEITPDQATDPTHRALAALDELWGAGEAGGGAHARAEAEAAGTTLPNPRRADRRREAAEQRRSDRLAGEEVAGFDEYDWDATFGGTGPVPHSPGTAHAPGGAGSAHYGTLSTPNRADAMAAYQSQVAANPHLESGVWRDANGEYHVMQGAAGSVAPPSGKPSPLELIYHSHPVTADPAMQSLNTQPSQAGGDFGVLQGQHRLGPVGRRQSSALHFPVYDANGRHVGYGETVFVYEPTHPLPLQVRTTAPGGRTTTHRYADFADYQNRARVGAGGGTPQEAAATFAAGSRQLAHDRAETTVLIDETTRALRPSPGIRGVREGRDLGRRFPEPDAAGRGPAYTARVAGLSPGESVEIPVNPAYENPPATTDELAALRERIAETQRAQADLGHTERAMSAQAAEQRGHDARLGQAAEGTRGLITGGQQQTAATARAGETNQRQQATAGDAIGDLGRAAQHHTAVATLVGSLRGFQGLAHLFGYLPGSLGRTARGASRDASELIAALGRVNDTEGTQAEVDGRRQGMAADRGRIDAVAAANQSTGTALEQGRDQVDELRGRNTAALAETQAAGAQAQREREAAAEDEATTQSTHDELLARMRAWAVGHRAARAAAVAEARARLAAHGYDAREVR